MDVLRAIERNLRSHTGVEYRDTRFQILLLLSAVIVRDAIRHLDATKAQDFLQEIEKLGATLTITSNVLASLSRQPAA